VFYSFTSPLNPTTVCRFDSATSKSTPFDPPKLTFDPSAFTTERVFATSKDGTRVPMFITRRKDLKKDGSNPTMLYGYGGFDIATLPTYRSDVPAWLERGGVWVTANMRGGSEYGESWHHAGMFEQKQHVYEDFIAAAEYLVKEKYASPQTLGIMGDPMAGCWSAQKWSSGRIFCCCAPGGRRMDMLRYHKLSGGSAWATEYGRRKTKSDFGLPVYRRCTTSGRHLPSGHAITTADHDDRSQPPFVRGNAAACGDKPVPIRIETRRRTGTGRPTSAWRDLPTSGRSRSRT
jgi:prolyl oligopeptidase